MTLGRDIWGGFTRHSLERVTYFPEHTEVVAAEHLGDMLAEHCASAGIEFEVADE